MTNDEAIDLLDNLIGMISDNQDSDYDEALKMAISALEKNESAEEWYKLFCEKLDSVENKGEWIPVSERLPEKDTNVLAYVKGVGIVYQRVMWIDDCTSEWVGFVGSGYQDEVIAWMPLPEPYKGGE